MGFQILGWIFTESAPWPIQCLWMSCWLLMCFFFLLPTVHREELRRQRVCICGCWCGWQVREDRGQQNITYSEITSNTLCQVLTLDVSHVTCPLSSVTCYPHQQPQIQTLCLLSSSLCTVGSRNKKHISNQQDIHKHWIRQGAHSVKIHPRTQNPIQI